MVADFVDSRGRERNLLHRWDGTASTQCESAVGATNAGPVNSASRRSIRPSGRLREPPMGRGEGTVCTGVIGVLLSLIKWGRVDDSLWVGKSRLGHRVTAIPVEPGAELRERLAFAMIGQQLSELRFEA
jgi:hypothetical protein